MNEGHRKSNILMNVIHDLQKLKTSNLLTLHFPLHQKCAECDHSLLFLYGTKNQFQD